MVITQRYINCDYLELGVGHMAWWTTLYVSFKSTVRIIRYDCIQLIMYLLTIWVLEQINATLFLSKNFYTEILMKVLRKV